MIFAFNFRIKIFFYQNLRMSFFNNLQIPTFVYYRILLNDNLNILIKLIKLMFFCFELNYKGNLINGKYFEK